MLTPRQQGIIDDNYRTMSKDLIGKMAGISRPSVVKYIIERYGYDAVQSYRDNLYLGYEPTLLIIKRLKK